MRCTGQPVSWLELELRALDELAPARAREVDAHLGACEACRTCLGRIESDRRALPPLPRPALAGAAGRVGRRRWRWSVRLSLAGALVAAAAALLVVWRVSGGGGGAGGAGSLAGVKGGDGLVVSLVRERAGTVTPDVTTFADGDRFEVLVTCGVRAPLLVDVVVFQGGRAYFPLAAARLACGNRVQVPGAFTLTGRQTAVVCVSARDRSLSACHTLAPE